MDNTDLYIKQQIALFKPYISGYPFLDFFAGSGLVTEGVKPYFSTVWANDISEKKANIYLANQDPYSFYLAPLETINGTILPAAVVSWASFPCQDLSVAGKQKGLDGHRSGLIKEWFRVTDEMPEKPPIVVLENVSGLTSSKNGSSYKVIHDLLTARNYRVGPLQLDAIHWVPQSRKRVFIIGVKKDIDLDGLLDDQPNWLHPKIIASKVKYMKDTLWWKLPQPTPSTVKFSDIIDFDEPFDPEIKSKHNVSLIPLNHMAKLKAGLARGLRVFPGYRRRRNGLHVLEIRTDDISGCLRTANGGSSREILVIPSEDGKLMTRLLTVREAARLMGVPDTYRIPGGYNDGYSAMGDAVALPVTKYLSENLLYPLARRCHVRVSAETAGV